MNNDYWKKYLEQRKRAEELHNAEGAPEKVIEEVHEEAIVEKKKEVVLEAPPIKEGDRREGQVRDNGLSVFRNGEWVKRFP